MLGEGLGVNRRGHWRRKLGTATVLWNWQKSAWPGGEELLAAMSGDDIVHEDRMNTYIMARWPRLVVIRWRKRMSLSPCRTGRFTKECLRSDWVDLEFWKCGVRVSHLILVEESVGVRRKRARIGSRKKSLGDFAASILHTFYAP